MVAGAVGATFSTSTIGSGFFTFPAQFPSPGNYLVTFSKPGYATQKFVVAATGAPVNLNVNLTPGAGSLSGEVFGPDGPLGGATVTVTDGTVTCSARTPTRGAVGKWSISGMTTPDTYLITATAPGYGASTTLVTLAAGQSSAGAKLILKAGVVSLVGNVASPKGPLGGINVTATDGTVTQSVTTLTGARDLSGGVVGTYVIPNLSVQGAMDRHRLRPRMDLPDPARRPLQLGSGKVREGHGQFRPFGHHCDSERHGGQRQRWAWGGRGGHDWESPARTRPSRLRRPMPVRTTSPTSCRGITSYCSRCSATRASPSKSTCRLARSSPCPR